MPIELFISKEAGWKTNPKTQKERGCVVVLNFVSTDTRKILFKYAPTLKDIDILFKLIEVLIKENISKFTKRIKKHE